MSCKYTEFDFLKMLHVISYIKKLTVYNEKGIKEKIRTITHKFKNPHSESIGYITQKRLPAGIFRVEIFNANGCLKSLF